jgi:hypothetical protein
MKNKKVLSGVLAGVMACSILVMPSSVEAASFAKTYKGQFSNDWSKVAKSGKAKIEYGFNTFAINEDTCYANHSGAQHYAQIRNGKGVYPGNSKKAGTVSKLEVTHSGSTVTYACIW